MRGFVELGGIADILAGLTIDNFIVLIFYEELLLLRVFWHNIAVVFADPERGHICVELYIIWELRLLLQRLLLLLFLGVLFLERLFDESLLVVHDDFFELRQ